MFAQADDFGQVASNVCAALHAAATRKGGDLCLTMCTRHAQAVLSAAAQQPGGRGRSAVRELETRVRATVK